MTFFFLAPVPVLRSVAPSGMLEGGKAVPVVIGGGFWFSVRRLAVWRSVVAAGGWWHGLASTRCPVVSSAVRWFSVIGGQLPSEHSGEKILGKSPKKSQKNFLSDNDVYAYAHITHI